MQPVLDRQRFQSRLDLGWHLAGRALLRPHALQGLSPGYRAAAWFEVSGARRKLETNPGLYMQLLQSNQHSTNSDTKTIEKDLSRTFEKHEMLKTRASQAALRRVLTAYCWKNSSVGYCQVCVLTV
jgi:hypothetical protein